MSKRHFWKKNPDYIYEYLTMIFKNSFFREMSKRHFWKKNPIEKFLVLPHYDVTGNDKLMTS